MVWPKSETFIGIVSTRQSKHRRQSKTTSSLLSCLIFLTNITPSWSHTCHVKTLFKYMLEVLFTYLLVESVMWINYIKYYIWHLPSMSCKISEERRTRDVLEFSLPHLVQRLLCSCSTPNSLDIGDTGDRSSSDGETSLSRLLELSSPLLSVKLFAIVVHSSFAALFWGKVSLLSCWRIKRAQLYCFEFGVLNESHRGTKLINKSYLCKPRKCIFYLNFRVIFGH